MIVDEQANRRVELCLRITELLVKRTGSAVPLDDCDDEDLRRTLEHLEEMDALRPLSPEVLAEVQATAERFRLEDEEQRRKWRENALIADAADTRLYTRDEDLSPEDCRALEYAQGRVFVTIAPPGSRPGYGFKAANEARRRALIADGHWLLKLAAEADREKSKEDTSKET